MVDRVVSEVNYKHCYVHVPFCARRCSYCDFAIAVRRVVPVDEFIAGLSNEWEVRRLAETPPVFDTLYFGGGTPSLLGADGVGRALDLMRSVATLAPGAEITLEANPEDISRESVAAWKAAGVNRLSIGVQSFHDNVLHWMHRVHDAERAKRAIADARDGGLDAFSIDLIFALPETLNRDWERDLDQALALSPDHISLYGLTFETHTPLGKWRSRGDVNEPSEEQYERQFLRANERLTRAGYEHYEVSNFARPGKRAVHNSAYWREVPYLGLGPSAHGFDGRVRRANISAYAAWDDAARHGLDPVANTEILTEENRITESIYLGLRTYQGLKISSSDYPTIAKWIDAGWLELVNSADITHIRCTPMGWLRLDALVRALTAIRSH